jgi:hypothetical protein
MLKGVYFDRISVSSKAVAEDRRAFGHPHVERETSLYRSEFHCVKHEARIIHNCSGPSRISAAYVS